MKENKEQPCRFLDCSKKSIVECRAHNATSCPKRIALDKKKTITQACWRMVTVK